MEYLEGETLADRLVKGPLPLDHVLGYGIEICEGLERAHKSGVVHRDLKPGNVMLTKTGAKLMDFGLAKAMTVGNPPSSGLTATLMSPAGGHPLTAQGTVVGTSSTCRRSSWRGKKPTHAATSLRSQANKNTCQAQFCPKLGWTASAVLIRSETNGRNRAAGLRTFVHH